MEFSLFVVVLIGLGTMFFGYFFGLFEGRGQGYKRRAAERPIPPPEVEERAPVVRDDPGLLRLKDVNGRSQVEMDGAPLPLEAVSPDQRKRLIELVTRLRPWIEGRPAAPVPAVGPASSEAAEPVPAAAPPSAPAPVSVPRTQPATAPGAAQKEEPLAPRTMVGQIDAILQISLAGTPLAQRGIRLEETPGGGVTVVVGLNRYVGVGEVPDPEVQAVIRSAIAEWEKKFTPGLA